VKKYVKQFYFLAAFGSLPHDTAKLVLICCLTELPKSDYLTGVA